MKVEVTQEHIDEGIPKNCYKCPIAMALYDCGYEEAQVLRNEIYLYEYELDEAYDYEYQNEEVLATDGNLKAFIDDFDSGKEVKPFWFYTEKLEQLR